MFGQKKTFCRVIFRVVAVDNLLLRVIFVTFSTVSIHLLLACNAGVFLERER